MFNVIASPPLSPNHSLPEDTLDRITQDCKACFDRFKIAGTTSYEFKDMEEGDYLKLQTFVTRLDKLESKDSANPSIPNPGIPKWRAKIAAISQIWLVKAACLPKDSVDLIAQEFKACFARLKVQGTSKFEFKDMTLADYEALQKFIVRLDKLAASDPQNTNIAKWKGITAGILEIWKNITALAAKDGASITLEAALKYYNKALESKSSDVKLLIDFLSKIPNTEEFSTLRVAFEQLIKQKAKSATPAQRIDSISNLQEAESYLKELAADNTLLAPIKKLRMTEVTQLIRLFKESAGPSPPSKSAASASVEAPPQLGHGPNTCFFATIMWTLFLNEPVILKELNATIARLENLSVLLEQTLLAKAKKSRGESIADIDIASIMKRIIPSFQSRGSAEADLADALGFLENPRVKREFRGDNIASIPRLPERLSALKKIRNLVIEANEAAKAGKQVPKQSMVALRTVLNQLMPGIYRANDQSTHDVTEIVHVMLNPFLDGSRLVQKQYTTRKYDIYEGYRPRADSGVNGLTGIGQAVVDANWGDLKVPLSGGSIQQMLNGYFTEAGGGQEIARYHLEGQPADTHHSEKVPFNLLEIKRQLDTAPPLLLLSLQRFNGLQKNNAFADLGDGTLVLNAADVKDGKAAKYELVSSMNHFGTLQGGHYTASVKRGNDHFYCDDMGAVYPIDRAAYLKSAGEVGYTLVYRKIS